MPEEAAQAVPAREAEEAAQAGQPVLAGQPEPWVWLARIRRPQGRKGEVFAEILTDFPEKFADRKQLWLLAEPSVAKTGPAKPSPAKGAGANPNPKLAKSAATPSSTGVSASQGGPPADSSASATPREVELIAHWLHKGGVVLHFAVIPCSERASLGEDEVYTGDLIGCVLVDVAQGNESGPAPVAVGEIEAVDRTAGPVALLVVRGAAGEVLIPFAKSYLRKIDLKARRVEMTLPKGLIDLNG